MSTILAFDFGEARIGVAMGSTELGIAHPLETIATVETDKRFARIEALIAQWQPALFVVGLPLGIDGEEQLASRLARKFANRLTGRFGLPVTLVDERYTSKSASMALDDTGLRGRRQKPVLDQVAAMQILQAHFDQIAEQGGEQGGAR
ncbi:Holliday junction resolvase RuvX [Jeongeupia chitinilytica]|uniref:Putative pre-16S rRNA nuclease n=1 Tax=Jeongeupia chitinilytica TaxID=1041641 RepID=A0ABQ3H5Y8_9NEIS|nr:Holliday junction resolvase RuvX [Jeongeupia chitinilytica]GHD69118.1 putative pre-16S rRNA nuclease [Jeongeupia chitinilytica]